MPMNNQSAPAVNIPFAVVGGCAFNVNSLIAIDLSEYEPGAEARSIELLLLGPHTMLFEAHDADEFYTWYLNLTGQAKIQPASPLVNPFAKQ